MKENIRDLLISMASHMAYMQGQLEAHHQYDDLEDYHWYRESVELRQKVTDALLADARDQELELASAAAPVVTTEMTVASSSNSGGSLADEQVGMLANAASRMLTQSEQQGSLASDDPSQHSVEPCDEVMQMPADNSTVDALAAQHASLKRQEGPSIP